MIYGIARTLRLYRLMQWAGRHAGLTATEIEADWQA